MFFEPMKQHHGLPYSPFKACVVPRPIGWISTISPDGTHANLAPYSQFNNLTFDPPYVMFSGNQKPYTGGSKDSVVNAERTGVFCWQLATYALREEMNITSEQVDYEVDEFDRAGLTKTWSKVLKTQVPMVEESPVKFECEYYTTLRLPGNPPMGSVDVVIGKVVGVHIKDEVLTNGLLDMKKTVPIARCGYHEYAVVRETFNMKMPGDQIMRDGLEGSIRANRAYGAKPTNGVPAQSNGAASESEANHSDGLVIPLPAQMPASQNEDSKEATEPEQKKDELARPSKMNEVIQVTEVSTADEVNGINGVH